MRVRVRVPAPVEMLRYVRRTNRLPIRTGAEPKVPAKAKLEQKKMIGIGHRGGVVHRLSGGANREAPAQPMNNAGEAIQTSKSAVSRVSKPNATNFLSLIV